MLFSHGANALWNRAGPNGRDRLRESPCDSSHRRPPEEAAIGGCASFFVYRHMMGVDEK